MSTRPDPPDHTTCRVTVTPRFACISGEPPELLQLLLPACRRLMLRIERHPRMLVLDLTGCDDVLALLTRTPRPQYQHEYGAAAWSEWYALADQLSRFLSVGDRLCRTHIGLAPTRTLAWLAALHTPASTPTSSLPRPRWHAIYVIAPEEARGFLRPLPLTIFLALPELTEQRAAAQEMLAALMHAGVTTVGQLRRLSGESGEALRRRFGLLGDVLLALATGRDLVPFRPERAPAWLGVRLHLAPPATAEQLTPSLHRLVEQLARQLSERQQAGCSLELVLRVDGGGILAQRHALARPVSTAAVLADYALRLLQTLLQPEGATQAPQAAHDTRAEPSYTYYTHLHLRIGNLRAVVPDQAHFWTLPVPARSARTMRAQRLRTALAPLALRYHVPPLLRAQCVAPYAVLPEARYALVDCADWADGAVRDEAHKTDETAEAAP